VELTQWIIAIGSLSSALLALALALGFREWLFRPRIRLVIRHESDPEEISDRIVTQRIATGEKAAFVRLRLDNRGRSTARNVAVSVLKVHRWDPATGRWTRARPELDGRLLQPSNQLTTQPDLVDVFPHSDRIVDLASVDFDRAVNGARPMFVEISHPWPPNEANALEPATWRLELLVCRGQRQIRTVVCHPLVRRDLAPAGDPAIWEHFVVRGPSPEISQPPEDAIRFEREHADKKNPV
jgi:hypothetical protein